MTSIRAQMSAPVWAPWRMDYILGPKAAGCIFCDFETGEPARFRADLVLVLQPHAFVCLNRYPFAASHLLVVSWRHVADLSELDAEEYAAFMNLVRDSVDRLKRAVNPQGINIGFNLGAAAGAGIADHLHAHIVPRWAGDTNFMPVLADVRVMPEYLDDSWRRLYPFLADLPGSRSPSPT